MLPADESFGCLQVHAGSVTVDGDGLQWLEYLARRPAANSGEVLEFGELGHGVSSPARRQRQYRQTDEARLAEVSLPSNTDVPESNDWLLRAVGELLT
jgi:hypothetical protein